MYMYIYDHEIYSNTSNTNQEHVAKELCYVSISNPLTSTLAEQFRQTTLAQLIQHANL